MSEAAERHLRKRSFQLAGHRTSVALEPEFWAALEGLAAARGQSLAGLVTAVDRERAQPLASALRVFALNGGAARSAPRVQPPPGMGHPPDPGLYPQVEPTGPKPGPGSGEK
ncbi:ribbon-helix-helix domain-containing protein [Siccirubricoccus phaeus]|uniref:ribbon-helix-helix domain-containing protein n=1 Tax=Siccirubricoccus phaeus TaxID=2595053 RepID=UPI0011F36587